MTSFLWENLKESRPSTTHRDKWTGLRSEEWGAKRRTTSEASPFVWPVGCRHQRPIADRVEIGEAVKKVRSEQTSTRNELMFASDETFRLSQFPPEVKIGRWGTNLSIFTVRVNLGRFEIQIYVTQWQNKFESQIDPRNVRPIFGLTFFLKRWVGGCGGWNPPQVLGARGDFGGQKVSRFRGPIWLGPATWFLNWRA